MRRSIYNRVRITWAAVFALAVTNISNAAVLTYFGSDDPRGTLTNSVAAFNTFTATLSSFGVDDIESYAGFSADPILTFGATGISAQSDINFVAAFPSLAVSGNNSLNEAGPPSAGGPAVNDTFTFNTPVTAFGSYFSQAGDGTTPNTISLLLENASLGTSKTVPIGTLGPGRTFDSVFFFGVTDTDPFNKVTLVETFDFDGMVLDNVTAGYIVVPEAGSVVLASALIVGLAIGAWHRRGRKPQ